jgi:hypothetical protein
MLRDQDENEARGMRNLTEGFKRRERRRRSRSAQTACSGGWRSGGGAVRPRVEERGVVRGDAGVLPAFIGRRRGRGGGVEAVARAQWPAAING